MRYDLYINEQLCDLDSTSLIVLTYTAEQLSNPTAVKNTYSHEVELPSTERNDAIFNHFYRNDYRVGVANFAPLAQVPFVIYNELGEIAEQGYIKLDEVTIDRTNHTYKVVLYGGLGSFFYAMGYADNGDALTLGDLQYMANAEDERLLDLRINRTTIDQRGAWGRLAGSNEQEQYDVINFAPTYQGLPEGDFSADKALFMAQAKGEIVGDDVVYGNTLSKPIYGITATQGDNAMYRRYEDNGNIDTAWRFSMVDLGAERTEWEVKDLRSYLQRPVLSVRKFVEAIQRRATAYGFTLNLDSSFFSTSNPYYDRAWLTLASLQSLSRPKAEAEVQLSGEVVVTRDAVQEIPIDVSMPVDENGYEFGSTLSNVTATLSGLSVRIPSAPNTRGLAFSLCKKNGKYIRGYNAWFIQLYGMNDIEEVVAWSDTKVLTGVDDDNSVSTIVADTGYTPKGGGGYTKVKGSFVTTANKLAIFDKDLDFAVSTIGTPTSWAIRIEKYNYKSNGTATQLIGDIEPNNAQWAEIANGEPADLFGTATVSANETVRSDVVISKRELFDIGKSPLEVLLSYCKLFGLIWHYEPNGNTITLQQRKTFYNEGNALNFERRIDRNREITIKPFEFDKRFYDFELETQGEWAEQYQEKYGRAYGAQRVNTGYNFDQDAKNLLEGNALKGGAEVLQLSKFYNNITQGRYTDGLIMRDKICPSVFLDGGKYALYDSNGNATEYDVTTPTNVAIIAYMNALQGYDYQPKAQLHSDNSIDDAGGMLLLFDGNIDIDNSPYKNFRLSDDVAEMGLLNDGKLCWILEGSGAFSLSGETMPKFVRVGSGVSLDMGVPQEIDNPDADAEAVQNSIFSQYWRDYLGDRYDTNSRVCQCYVDLRGLQVGNALFRNFYYFDNAVWVLNKINNYSMTTVGTTLCEFVKVQDIRNYKGE